jgi:hypothetical protein
VEVDTNDSKFVDADRIIDSGAFATPPSIYFDEPESDHQTAFIRVLQWIRNANNARAKEIRLQAAFYFFSGGSKLSNKNQVALAREIGSTKAAISQKAVEFQDYFAEKLGLKDTMERVSRAAGMRSNEARQKFAEVCKSNHQKRKASRALTESQRPSEVNISKQPSFRETALRLAKQPLSPPLSADQCSIAPKSG